MWSKLEPKSDYIRDAAMTTRPLSDQELLEKLNTHPTLRERVSNLLLAVEDETGDLTEADAAEMRIIDEMRQMGHESLSAWAQRQALKATETACQAGSVWREGKKNSAGTRPLGS
jgi:fructoselysine-6-P-deglycase FrlB-like protein